MEVKKTPITRHFDTGAVRGEDTGRGKPSLLPFEAISMVSRCFGGIAFSPITGIIEISKVYEAGAQKYEDRNWEKGIPFSAFVDSAIRHFEKFIRFQRDEPHCGQFAWNLTCLLQTYIWVGDKKISETLNDLPQVEVDIDSLRSEPLPTIEHGLNLSEHANMAFGCLSGFCYGKHPINLAAAVGHALCLLNDFTMIENGDISSEFDDLGVID